MSTVFNRIPEVVRQHPSYKADRKFDSETGFRYVFGHRDDHNRELMLTILVFDVPEAPETYYYVLNRALLYWDHRDFVIKPGDSGMRGE